MALRVDELETAFGPVLRLANGEVEVTMPTAYGPRVLEYRRAGGNNVLGLVPPDPHALATSFGEPWHIRGGHRLWYAPEDEIRTYHPDNVPVLTTVADGTVTLAQAPEAHTGIVKTLTVTLAASGTEVTIGHRLDHRGRDPIELAPWALTVMAAGGTAVFPQAPFVPHPVALRPARPLVLWPFTRMADPRFTWGDGFVRLRHDANANGAQKIGLYDGLGYLAYLLPDVTFVKTHRPMPGTHADYGCNVETFTDQRILELETLGPLVRLEPGRAVLHEETWRLADPIDPATDDEGLRQRLGGYARPSP